MTRQEGLPHLSTVIQPSPHPSTSSMPPRQVSCIAPSGQASSQVVSTSWDGTAVLWDCTSTGPRRVSELRPGQHAVHAAAWCHALGWRWPLPPTAACSGTPGLRGEPRAASSRGWRGSCSGGGWLRVRRPPGPDWPAACESEQAVYLGTDAGGLLWLDRRAAGGGRPQTLASPHTEGIRQLLP